MKKQNFPTSFGVIGLGRFGTALVRTLAEAGKEVIAVDKDESKVKAVRKYTDFAFVIETLTEEALEETGIQNCQTVTICIGEQVDVSVLTTMMAIKMGIPHVISKANSREHGEVLKHLGATVVYPESDMAVRIGKRMISGNLLDYISLDNQVEIRRIQVGGHLVGCSVQQADVRRKYSINIIAVERDHQTMVDFSPQFRFQIGDIIAVIGKADHISRFDTDMQQ
nr:TrkA family potassium uptake protein [uncultured Agathobaculum sp.]